MITDTYYPSQDELTTIALSPLGSAALSYASHDIPVFPLHEVDATGKCSCREGASCESPGKHPRIKKNLVRATTDKVQIHTWWERWPNANIAILTGHVSRLVSFDMDTYKPGAMTPDDVEEKLGKLPDTRTISTGSDGLQMYYLIPEGEILKGIPENGLGPGLCVKANGGYVVAPPSRTKGAYETTKHCAIADAPDWLLKALRNHSRRDSKPVASSNFSARSRGERITVQADGPIKEGIRNNTLTKYGGRLRAWGYEEKEILEILRQINEQRCSPPLSDREVAGIAQSVARYPAGTAKRATRKAGPEVTEVVTIIAHTLLNYREWPGVGGKNERSVVAILTMLAMKYGELIPTGVRLEVSYRDLALMAATSLRTITRVIRRLKEKGILRADNYNRSKEEAGALVLLHPGQGVHTPTNERGNMVGVDTLTTPRLRNSAPGILRLGKSCEAFIDHLDASGGTLDLEVLAALMGSSCTRYLKRKILPRLVDAGIVAFSGDNVTFTCDWLAELERERERAGEISAANRDMARYAREREAYRNRTQSRPERVPERPPAGEIKELERVPERPNTSMLYSLMNQNVLVRTSRGRGYLWQVFSDRVGVVLDSNKSVVEFLDPSELILEAS